MGIALEITIVLWLARAAAWVLELKLVATAPAKKRVSTETRTKSFMMWLPQVKFFGSTSVPPNKMEYNFYVA
jgi:hypothetical protein